MHCYFLKKTLYKKKVRESECFDGKIGENKTEEKRCRSVRLLDLLHSWAHRPFFQLQSQQHRLFKSLSPWPHHLVPFV